jgi:hypothetical protein
MVKPKKTVWIKTNRTRAKVSIGIGRKRMFLRVELFGDARDRVVKQIMRWSK